MHKHALFLLCAVAFVGVNADGLSDFSNNLVTDIGPLLVLFGDSMTRQYLSESTSFLDYFIFAMAPIGILTAIVSTIRVCGHSSLRAFIGRSQEGNGTVEAELCTSTSRDVCELFNRGGITRVLGRPSIIELVHVPRCGNEKLQYSEVDKAGLFLFRNYLQMDDTDWEKPTKNGTNMFAPNPNLSLNVGIVKRPFWVFVAVAAIGLVLQAGVLVLAGIGVWILHWNLNGQSAAKRDYAPVMFIVGTVLMCGGMWCCAALIGQTTYETQYRRSRPISSRTVGDKEASRQSRLFWLQPGPQVIGDQSFDPFAYFEAPDDPLVDWTSSKKDFDEKFESYTLVAVLVVLIGYFMQFIGLRGMKAWVSLAQLGITVVMSILRGFLRMQRLGRDANRLASMPDMIAGYELDWLAFKIAQQESQQESSWHVNGQHEKAIEAKTQSSSASSSDNKSDQAISEVPTSRSQSPTAPQADRICQVDGNDLLLIRERLAHLTGHIAFSDIGDREYQKWKDDYVKVRTNAKKLSAAICLAAESLVRKYQVKKDIILRVKAVGSPNGDASNHPRQLISVILKPPPESSQGGWRVDSARLEAILGLWNWSLVSDHRLETKDDSGHKISKAETIKQARIVSAGPDDNSWDCKTNRQGEMDLWLGLNAIKLLNATSKFDKAYSYSPADLWMKPTTGEETDWEPLPKDRQSYQPPLQRLCGWNPVYESLISRALDSTNTATSANTSGQQLDEHVKLRLQYVSTNDSLLDICTQELFAGLMASLTGLQPIDTPDPVENAGNVQLDNPTVSALAKAFVENGLGSHPTALLCIIPALGKQLPSLAPDLLVSALIKRAETHRQESEWERAETLLQWACQRFSSSHGEEVSTATTSDNSVFATALRATGELYRWSFAQRSNDERKKFGLGGVKWMNENYRRDYRHNQDVTDILDCYKYIADKMATEPPSGKGSRQDTVGTRHSLMEAIRDRHRGEALYRLCFTTTGDFGHENLQAALPLAVRNDWEEVSSAILEMKARPDSQDEDGRTAISYCAELGYGSYLKRFMDLGGFLDLADKKQQTPLHWAAVTGHTHVVKLLLDTGHVDSGRLDEDGQTSLHQAAVNGNTDIAKLLVEAGADKEAKNGDGWTPLYQAARNRHTDIAKLLVEEGADKEAKNGDGLTPLYWAAYNGYTDIAKLLVEAGADKEAKDGGGWTPLRQAAYKGYTDIAKLLVEEGADKEAKDGDGWTLLHQAARNGYTDIAKLLVKAGANKEAKDGDGLTPLYWAARNGYTDIAKLLVEAGADKEAKDGNGRTPLHRTAYKGYTDIAKLLIEAGADKEAKNGDGRTPLYWAARNGYTDIAKLLVEAGADKEAKDGNDRTPLHQAAVNGHTDIAKLLVEAGADKEAKDGDGSTPLHWAAYNGYTDIAKLLVEAGANKEAKDEEAKDGDGSTPLHWAAVNGHTDIAKLLVEAGANKEAKDGDGRTPLYQAARNRHTEIAKLLVKADANKEAKDGDGLTPLHWAAVNGHTDIAKLLVEAGADKEANNGDGWTPLYWAAYKGYTDIAKLLVEAGADKEAKIGDGWTLLYWAAYNGYTDIAKLLVEAGADKEAKDGNDRTPLHQAAVNGDTDIAKLLIEAGANKEAKDGDGRTPLYWAARNGYTDIAKLLVEAGANKEAKDEEAKDGDGRTPLHQATDNGYTDLAKLLK
jgi:ankyrin repeat protein